MHNIMVIAQGTMLRQLRNKVLYLLIILSLSFVAVGSMYKVLSLGAETKLMRDLGLAGINLVGMVVAVFIGANEVGKEIREGTVDDLLAKPLGREEFLLGKYVGTLLVAFVNVAIISVCFMGIMFYYQGNMKMDLFRGIIMNMFEISVLISVAIFFTTFLPEAVSAVVTFLVFIMGHGAHMLPLISDKSGEWPIRWMSTALFYLIPNLHHFNLRAAVGHQIAIPWTYVACALIYAVCYTGMILSLAVLVFRTREL